MHKYISFDLLRIFNSTERSPLCTNLWSFRYLTENGELVNGAKKYTVDACYDLCVQRYVMSTCHCIDSTITFTDLELGTNYTMCGHMNITRDSRPTDDDVQKGLKQLDCMFTAKTDIQNEDVIIKCHCPIPCTEYFYQLSVSSSPWPHR